MLGTGHRLANLAVAQIMPRSETRDRVEVGNVGVGAVSIQGEGEEAV